MTDYTIVKRYLKVSSADRDPAIYPSSSSFSIDLPVEYRNIVSVELIQGIIPDKNNVSLEPYLILSIDEIPNTIDAIDRVTSDAFAILMLSTPPLTVGSFISVNTHIHKNTVLYFNQTPKAKLSKMTIKIKNSDGDIFDFGGSGSTSKATQSTFFFKITERVHNTRVINNKPVY